MTSVFHSPIALRSQPKDTGPAPNQDDVPRGVAHPSAFGSNCTSAGSAFKSKSKREIMDLREAVARPSLVQYNVNDCLLRQSVEIPVSSFRSSTGHYFPSIIYYHSQCRKIFTMKCLLDGIFASRRKSKGALISQHPDCSIATTKWKRQRLTNSIGPLVVDNPSLTSMMDLTRFYTNQLWFYGEMSVPESVKINLRRKLDNQFNEYLHFVQGMYLSFIEQNVCNLNNFIVMQCSATLATVLSYLAQFIY